ncbi:hypothetical protein [Cyclobacterium sp. 1_MG-2023]|uniref:hypothetical protein n=1 Tax=Cyclobacterium sp. 1_MG-2023 TaxID=3062681 RepID=UPI0026E20137|nr:hypothetical protein [Cyclobacterium sp. 1_MG-2023]
MFTIFYPDYAVGIHVLTGKFAIPRKSGCLEILVRNSRSTAYFRFKNGSEIAASIINSFNQPFIDFSVGLIMKAYQKINKK